MRKLPSFSEFNKIINESSGKKNFSFSSWLVENANPQVRAQVASMSNDDALKKAELIMELVKQKLFTHFPLFRPFMKIMPPIARVGAGSVGPDGIGTMSTSGSAIYYDPKFVVLSYEQAKNDFFKGDSTKFPSGIEGIKGKRHPMDYALFVVVHEILHNSLKHFLREPEKSPHLSEYEIARLWNLATDFEINHILKDDSVARGICVMYPGGVDADDPTWGVPDGEKEFFKNSSAERIFNRLLKNLEAKRAEQQKQDNKQESDEQEGETQDEQGQEQEGEDQEGESESGDEGEEQEGNGEQEGEGGEGGEDEGDGEGESEGGEGGESSSGSSGDGGEDSETKLKVGDIIFDRGSGTYGVITSMSGGDIEFDELSEVEAKKRLGIE